MSLLTTGIGLAKKAKRKFKKVIEGNKPVYLSKVRRLERVCTQERVCAIAKLGAIWR